MAAMQDSGAGITLENHQIGNDVHKHCFSGTFNASFQYKNSL